MADLDNLLLQAAGRPPGRNRHSVPPSKRRHNGSDSDGGSDSRDDDSDDDRGYASRKPSGSQVPLKKRLDPTDRDDDDQGSQEGGHYDDDQGSDDSDIGEDLYKNDDDRRKLAQMSELEREMILSERADKKGDKNLTEKLRSKRENEKATTQSRKDTTPLPSSRGVRSSARSADRAAGKDDALNQLRAKKMAKQRTPDAHRKLRDTTKGGSTGNQGISPIKRKAFTSASVSSSSHSESERSHSDDEGSTGDGIGDSDDEGGLKFEDIKEITIRRSKLAKWLMEPFFEDLIVGCYVRVGIGTAKGGKRIYRLCNVRNVDATDPNKRYKLENTITHKFLDVVWGNDSSNARWQMAMVSDSPPVEEEFKQLLKEIERNGGRMPSKQHVLEKKEAIKKINSYVYSAATVKQMLEEKKSAAARPLNVALEKDRLRRQLEIAQLKKNEAEVERIKTKLQQLEASRQVQEKDSKAVRLAEMNRKNRVENFKNASESKRSVPGLKAGEEGYDPFSRRWTRSSNYFSSKKAAAADVPNNGTVEAVGPVGEAGVETTVAALEAAAGAGKLIDTSAPVDGGTETYMLHNFDLDISLAMLQKYGGPHGAQEGYLARKQRIEASVGYKVPENDGRRHALTLTVGDYKRRRGLL